MMSIPSPPIYDGSMSRASPSQTDDRRSRPREVIVVGGHRSFNPKKGGMALINAQNTLNCTGKQILFPLLLPLLCAFQPHFPPSDRLTIFPSHQSSKLRKLIRSHFDHLPTPKHHNMSTEVSTNEDRKVALVTGITGQDGSYLTELLLEKGYTVSLFVMDHPRSE